MSDAVSTVEDISTPQHLDAASHPTACSEDTFARKAAGTMRHIHPIANGLSTDHPVRGIPFADDALLPRQPQWIENVGRHRNSGTWGRCDGAGHGPATSDSQWAVFTTAPHNPDYAWSVRHHPDHGRTVVLVRNKDVASLHESWIADNELPLLFRGGGYWWDGQRWYRPRQVYDEVAATFARRLAVDAHTVTGADLLTAGGADPTRAVLRTVEDIDPDTRSGNWLDGLALWAAQRPERARALTACVVDLEAPELDAGQLVDIEVLAAMDDLSTDLVQPMFDRGHFPASQAVLDGRSMWSKPVAADWLETHERSAGGLRDAMSTATPENPRLVTGNAEVWDFYTDSFTSAFRIESQLRNQRQLTNRRIAPRRRAGLSSLPCSPQAVAEPPSSTEPRTTALPWANSRLDR